MADQLGVPTSDLTMEDKLAYKKEMKRLVNEKTGKSE